MNADFYKLVRTLDGLKEDPTGTKQLENGKTLLKESEQLLKEKAVSQAQQKFMGMVHAAQKGKKPASPEVAKVAKGMSHKAAKDYASTKHKGLPKKVKEGEVWRPGMTPPPNPDMGSSLTPGEQKRVVTPQGPEGVQQPYLPSQPKKPAPAAPSTSPKKTSELDVDTQIAETSLEEYGYGSTFFVVAKGNRPEMFTRQQDAIQRQKAYTKQGRTATIHLNSPEGKIIASPDDTMRSRDMERIAAYSANRQSAIDNELDAYLQYKRDQSIRKGQQAALDRADAEVYQLGAGRRINPTDPEDKLGRSGIVKDLEIGPAQDFSLPSTKGPMATRNRRNKPWGMWESVDKLGEQPMPGRAALLENMETSPEKPYEVKPGENFSKVFEPGRNSGVHFHLMTGRLKDPFYFRLNSKLYSVSSRGDGIPREVGVDDNDLGKDVPMPNLIDYKPTTTAGGSDLAAGDSDLELARQYAKLMGYDPNDMEEISLVIQSMRANPGYRNLIIRKVRGQGVAEGTDQGREIRNKKGTLLGTWDGRTFTMDPSLEQRMTEENGPEWIESFKNIKTQELQQQSAPSQDRIKYYANELEKYDIQSGQPRQSRNYYYDLAVQLLSDQQGVAEGSSQAVSDITVKKIRDGGYDGLTQWHVFRGDEMIGYVNLNQEGFADGLYLAYGHGPGRAEREEFNGLKSAVNFIAGLRKGVAEASPKPKHKDRLPIYQESKRYKTINNLIREEFDLDDLDKNGLSLEEKDIKAALGDQLFNELQAVKNGEADISENLKDALFNYYKNSGELPPEIRQDENDVSEYIADKINSMKTNDSSDRLSVSEDRKVSGTRYGGGAQQDDEEEGEGTDKKPEQPEVKRGRGRPPKAGSQSTNPEEKRKQKDREEAGKALQSMIVGNQPKKSKSLEKLPTTKHKMKG